MLYETLRTNFCYLYILWNIILSCKPGEECNCVNTLVKKLQRSCIVPFHIALKYGACIQNVVLVGDEEAFLICIRIGKFIISECNVYSVTAIQDNCKIYKVWRKCKTVHKIYKTYEWTIISLAEYVHKENNCRVFHSIWNLHMRYSSNFQYDQFL